MDHLHSTTTEHRKGKHLSYEERVVIQTRLKDGWTPNRIAREIGCVPNTVRNEIKRGTVSLYRGNVFRYKASAGQATYERNRAACCRHYEGLIKYKIGDLISVIDERNDLGIKDFYGININKEFMPTAANTEGLDETKYKVVRKNRFVYSGMQTGRDECIRISMYTKENPIIVSPAYTTFEVSAVDKVIPLYFFMKFLTKEKDRYGAFCSDGSIRSNLDWDVFCDIEIELPTLEIQQKYVDIYNAMLSNQQSYERGLDDLKLTIDISIDRFKHTSKKKCVGQFFKEVDCINSDGLVEDVQGINITKQFMPSVANTNGVDLTKYKIVNCGQFAFSGMQTGRDECIRIAYFAQDESIIISPAYTVLENTSDEILNEYIMIWFSRKEVDRLGWFMSDASIRTNLDKERFYEIEIPVPDKSVQKAIVDIYSAYNVRKLQ